MSKNKKNILKWIIAVAGLALFGYSMVQIERDNFGLSAIIALIVSAVIAFWYVRHVFTDE